MSSPPSHLEFAQFYAATVTALTAQLRLYSGSLEEAQDVVQEAFCRAYERWDVVCGYDDPVAWVRTVAWNLATSRWRRLRRLRVLLPRLVPFDVPEPDARHVDLLRALHTLNPRHRQAILLHYVADLGVQEIADTLAVAPGTVKSWLSRGREQLHKQLAMLENSEAADA